MHAKADKFRTGETRVAAYVDVYMCLCYICMMCHLLFTIGKCVVCDYCLLLCIG